MADTKISGLPAASVVAAANELAVNEAGTSKKVTALQLKTFINTGQIPVYNVKTDYAATGDGKRITDGAITTGTAILTSASNPFVSTDVGKTIGVSAAGSAAITAPGAPTVAAAAGSHMAVGVYKYKITFLSTQGETPGGTESANATTTLGNQRVALTAIPTGGAGTTHRGIYRTVVNGATNTEKLVCYLFDNTTTVYTDTMPDYFLGAAVPTVDTTAEPLVTTILTYTSAGQVTLNANASRTATGSICTWGTNDTTAIHNARNAAGASVVYFPPGTYMSPQLTANVAGQTWLLDPNATIRLMPAATGTQVIDVTAAADGFRLIDGIVDGNKDNIGACSSPLIRLHDSTSLLGAEIGYTEITGAHEASTQAAILTTRDYVNIHDCYIHDSNQPGIIIQTKASTLYGTAGTNISDNEFVNLKYVGVGQVGDQGRITLNTTITSTSTSIVATAAIPTKWPQVGTIVIEQETIRYTSYTGSTFTTVAAPNGRGYAGTTAAAHTAPTNITIGEPDEGSRHRGTHITNNIFKNCGWTNDGWTVGAIEIWYANYYTAIVNNYMEDNRSFAAMSIVGCYWAKVQMNIVIGPTIPCYQAKQWALELGNGKHYTVTGNSFDMRTDAFQQPNTVLSNTRGIVWTGSVSDINRDNAIVGNTITNVETGMSPAYSFGNVITGNGFYNFYTSGVHYDSGSTVQNGVGDMISGNVFRNPSGQVQGTGVHCGVTAGFGATDTNVVANQFTNCTTGINTGNSSNTGLLINTNDFIAATTTISGSGVYKSRLNDPDVANDDRILALGADHAISSITATEVTGLEVPTLRPGTYTFEYSLIVQSATLTVGPTFGVNFTGTAAVKTMIFMYAENTAILTAATGAMDDQMAPATNPAFIMGGANKAYTTTAPNMYSLVGVSTVNSDTPAFIKGTVVVTASGNLELWHGSETATSTTVMAGSSVRVARIA